MGHKPRAPTAASGQSVDTVTQSGFNQASWLPVRSWTYSGGDCAIAVVGDRFLIAERAKPGSLDELSQLLRAGRPGSPVEAEAVSEG